MDVREKTVTGMAEYIERETAIETIISEPPDAHYPHWYADKIKAIPAADVAPVRHGRWLCVDTDTEHFFLCNRCKKKEFLQSNYCRSCGAKMDGDDPE